MVKPDRVQRNLQEILTGKSKGMVVDAWFTGFAENAEGKLYFCLYLGRTDK